MLHYSTSHSPITRAILDSVLRKKPNKKRKRHSYPHKITEELRTKLTRENLPVKDFVLKGNYFINKSSLMPKIVKEKYKQQIQTGIEFIETIIDKSRNNPPCENDQDNIYSNVKFLASNDVKVKDKSFIQNTINEISNILKIINTKLADLASIRQNILKIELLLSDNTLVLEGEDESLQQQALKLKDEQKKIEDFFNELLINEIYKITTTYPLEKLIAEKVHSLYVVIDNLKQSMLPAKNNYILNKTPKAKAIQPQKTKKNVEFKSHLQEDNEVDYYLEHTVTLDALNKLIEVFTKISENPESAYDQYNMFYKSYLKKTKNNETQEILELMNYGQLSDEDIETILLSDYDATSTNLKSKKHFQNSREQIAFQRYFRYVFCNLPHDNVRDIFKKSSNESSPTYLFESFEYLNFIALYSINSLSKIEFNGLIECMQKFDATVDLTPYYSENSRFTIKDEYKEKVREILMTTTHKILLKIIEKLKDLKVSYTQSNYRKKYSNF